MVTTAKDKKPQAFASGLGAAPLFMDPAAIAQAQNQQPDSIPGMFKPGEVVLPPDTVHALGGKAVLQAAIDRTHTPSQGGAQVPLGFKPEMFLANGGAPEDQLPGPGLKPSAAPSPSNTFPGNRLQGDSGSSGAPVGATPKSVAAAAPAVARQAGPSELYMQDRAQEMRDQWGSGNYAQAAGTAVRTAAQGLGMYGIELADKAATPVIGAVGKFASGLLGSDASAAPASDQGARTPQYATLASIEGTMKPPAPTSAPAQQPQPLQNDVTREGNSYSGTNISGDISINGKAPGRNGGQISAQNMAAADNLTGRYGVAGLGNAPSASPSLGAAPLIEAAGIRHSGNDWAARQNLKNLETSASSITNRPEWNSGAVINRRGQVMSGTADPNGKVAAYQQALATDAALQQAQPGMAQAAMRENAGLQREGMQQAGADRRAQASTSLAMQRLAMDQETQGYANRAAGQTEQLRGVLLDPNATPQQRQSAQQALMTLSGHQPADPYLVVPGGQQIDQASGRAYNTPSTVFNRSTGQFMQQPGQQSTQSPYPDGQELTGKDGKTYVVRNGAPVLK